MSPGVQARLPARATPPLARLGAGLKAAADHLLFWAVLANLVLSCLLWTLPAILLARILPRRWRAGVGQYTAMLWSRWFIWTMQRTGRVQCDLTALDALRDEGALVIAANHHTLLDAVLIVSRLPRLTCIAKAGLWDNVFFGGGIRLAGYIRNDAPHRLLRAAARRLSGPGGRPLLIFPEGTRVPSGQVGRFRPGFAAMARMAGVPVQTVIIETNSPYLGKGWPVWRRPAFPLRYTARLGRRFEVSGSPQDFARVLERYFRDELARTRCAASS